ncbi:hypothetical protein [Gorillibacterium timonense]|uniref:hypothetical protein n=1 Tax=Gorillibacterium timonense TaxID=1689269 RepID=UPI00071D957C|nr:hypothetical protein [Gorillibacterium timonense]
MTEKSILAYFRTREEAEEAAQKLRSLRALDARVDSFSRFPGGGSQGLVSPVTGNVSGLASMTLNADVDSRDTGVLLAADPSASGLSDGGSPTVTGHNYVLSAVVTEDAHHQALSVVEQAGGYF